ncbi:MAG: hypothetical protein FVQ84_22675 [Planctomycetes bacterium]|nr:hypothetical protein [Planctomycetota bacterium]
MSNHPTLRSKAWAFIRHNSGIIISLLMVPVFLIYAYGCQSTVVSLVNSDLKVTRAEFTLEVEHFLAAAELKYSDLDRQDLARNTIFNSLAEVAQGKVPDLPGVMLLIGNILGLGAIVDNVRKRTHINTLKSFVPDNKAKS